MLSNLSFALDVMEERRHIGLDDKRAAAMRRVLLNRIVEAEKALGDLPAAHSPCAHPASKLVTA
jgi:hypothetical protein